MRFLIPLLFAVSCLAQNEPSILQSTSRLRLGLAGYWRLEESSGTRYDYSSAGVHLTSNNSVGNAAGVSTFTGNCATFVLASSQYLSGGTSQMLLNSFANWTICYWFKLTTTNTVQIVASKDNPAITREWGTYWNSTGKVGVYIGTGLNTTISSLESSVVDGTVWNLASVGRSNSVLFVSVNGGTRTTGSISVTPGNSNNPFYVGRYNSGAPLYLNGKIDELGIWTRVLTTTEVSQIYNAGSGTHFPWSHP